MNGIIKRLKRIEERSPKRITILAEFDGVKKECTVDELEANKKAKFIKVIRGNSLTDADRLLKQVDDAEVCLSCNKSECNGDIKCFQERRQQLQRKTRKKHNCK